jgi:type I restriction enzyme S subunit
MTTPNYLEKLLDLPAGRQASAEVAWKPLESISIKVSSGGTPPTGNSEYYDGDIPWLRTQEVDFGEIWDTGVKITEAGLKNSSASWIPKNCVIVAMYGATVGKIGINKIPMTTNQACANIHLDENVADYRYVFHFLSSQYEYIKSLGAGSQTNINAGIVKKLQIPIPCPDDPQKSLAIQAEIVRILDAFTELTTELTTRKKQYNYYRDHLLSFKEGEVEWKSLGDLCVIGDGLHGTPEYDDKGDYFFINGNNLDNGNIVFNDKTKKVNHLMFKKHGIVFTAENTVFLSINGTIGSVSFYNNEKIVLGKSVAFFNITSSELYSRYLFYFLQIDFSKNYFETKKTGSTIKNLGLNALRSFKIPIPTYSEQKRIVDILDKFDALTNSITEGLPREIELRQKQYAYYRDLLLNFPPSDHPALSGTPPAEGNLVMPSNYPALSGTPPAEGNVLDSTLNNSPPWEGCQALPDGVVLL